MRYNLESYLPINAFQPLVKHSPFKLSMTLEGGGGGIISAITDPISSVLGTDGGDGGILGGLADVDKFVGNEIPGGWGTIAAVAVPFLAPEALIAAGAMEAGTTLSIAQSAALAAGTSAATGAIQGRSLEDILKNAAMAGATSYGLNSLFSGAGVPDGGVNDAGAGSTGYGEANDLPNSMEPSPDPFKPDTPLPDIPPEVPEIPPEIPPEVNFDLPPVNQSDVLKKLVDSEALDAAVSNNVNNLDSEQARDKLIKELSKKSYSPMNSIEPSDFDKPIMRMNGVEPTVEFSDTGTKITDYSSLGDARTQALADMGLLDRAAQLPGYLYDTAMNNKLTTAALVFNAYALMNGKQEQPTQGQPKQADSTYKGGYGSPGGIASPYLLRNRVNANNVYQYRSPTQQYAEGGEVQHFAGGGVSNFLTKAFQPIEKAVIQPVGQALPFLKDVAPYAGLLAAPFIGSTPAAIGLGALSSGFGRPGTGFDMKRALMGGIAAYGASTVGAGLEAAGGGGESTGFFRDTGSMTKGLENLMASDSTAAMEQFGTKAGAFKSGIPLVMGTTGVMAIDEARQQQEAANNAAIPARQEQADMLSRIAKGKQRAQDAVRENPYMYAVGGAVDDEIGIDEARGLAPGNLQQGLFMSTMPRYAAGGVPRFLSGGGDGMSDSIHASIEGKQEARLADGEFVIPADVVSHLGNGSSKAGAKQLYSMMDRVRKARTGNKRQGIQIKPSKMMPI